MMQHPVVVPLSRSLLLPVSAVIIGSASALLSTFYEELSVIIKQDCMAHPAFKRMALRMFYMGTEEPSRSGKTLKPGIPTNLCQIRDATGTISAHIDQP